MSWSELIDTVSTESGVPRETTRKVLVSFIRVATRWLGESRDVQLRGFGTFTSRMASSRVVRSVSDQRKMYVGARLVARFKTAAGLRQALASSGDDGWRTPEHQAAWRLAETLIGDLDLYHGNDAPEDLEGSLGAPQVEAACAKAFGAAWRQVESSYAERVPRGVIDETHYLGIAARRRWSRA
ncbi:MAG: HU family DNA-binding protein [Myxococcota bacterium]